MRSIPVYNLLFLVVFSLISCHQENERGEVQKQYTENIGEIVFDPQVDKAEFLLCDSTTLIQSRLAISYKGGIQQIEEKCKALFNTLAEDESYSGYIMVRFIINCEREVGRLRFQTLDEGFLHQDCPKLLVNQVKKCVHSLDGWVFTRSENEGKDHSKFLNFKMKNGQIESIIH